ncbi:MAG: FAD-dependent oxidoreductase [Actinobacteria bacterium]|nr:FAD-dependent oxidoreductase [Actinomycetota bacterium]
MPPTEEADVCIVGAGIAGLYAALALPEGLDVVVIDRSSVGQGSSPHAQGGMAAAMGPGDSPELHLADTVAAGAGLVDTSAAEVLCHEVPDRVRDLVALGCRFDRTGAGSLHLAREGAQTVPRSVHRADATGAEMVRVLREAAGPRVRRVEAFASALLEEGRVYGVSALTPEGPIAVAAGAVLLATGGVGALFSSTTNPPASTGAAIGLAHRAGARLADLEFVQFHPTALAVPGSPRPLVTEALRGAGAHLLDREGNRLMEGVHPDMELAPRDVVTAAILAAGGAFLDARHLGAGVLEAEFPTVLASCRARGLDPATDLLPVEPAAHYAIGGVATDLEGRTSRPGLSAAGECAATGVHGANRMPGNSLAEAVVFGRRAALAIAREMPAREDRRPAGEPVAAEGPPLAQPAVRIDDIVRAVSLGAGPVRDEASARRALDRLGAIELASGGDGGEGSLALLAGRLLVTGALARAETRGVHVRADHPLPDPALEGVHLTWEPIPGEPDGARLPDAVPAAPTPRTRTWG